MDSDSSDPENDSECKELLRHAKKDEKIITKHKEFLRRTNENQAMNSSNSSGNLEIDEEYGKYLNLILVPAIINFH